MSPITRSSARRGNRALLLLAVKVALTLLSLLMIAVTWPGLLLVLVVKVTRPGILLLIVLVVECHLLLKLGI